MSLIPLVRRIGRKRSAIEDLVHHLSKLPGGKLDPAGQASPLKIVQKSSLGASAPNRYCKITAGGFQNHVSIVQRLSTPGTAASSETETREKKKKKKKKKKKRIKIRPISLQSTAPAPGVELIYGCFDRKIDFLPPYTSSPHLSSRIQPWQLLQETRLWSRLRLRSEQKTGEWLFRETRPNQTKSNPSPSPHPTPPWHDLAFAAVAS